MPVLARPEGIPVGQLGKVTSVNPRAEDAGLGTVLRQAAAMEFAAGAQKSATGNQMVQFGLAQTEAGLELLKPFKKLRDSREVLAADDIAIQAKLVLRSSTGELQSSGALPHTWGESFQKTFATVSGDALKAAGLVSPAAQEHVYKELQGEYLSLFTDLVKKSVEEDQKDQLGMLERKEMYELQSAVGSRDPAIRTAHIQSYKDAVDRLVFNKGITPLVGQQKKDYFDKRFREEHVAQVALDEGLIASHNLADSYAIPPTERDALKDKAEDVLRFQVNAEKAQNKAADKQHRLDQSAQYMVLSGRVLTESNPQALLTLLYKLPEYAKTGSLHPTEGKLLKGDIEKRLNDLAKPTPEVDIPEITEDIEYRIVTDAMSVTEPEIRNTRGISPPTRTKFYDMKRSRMSSQHYSHLRAYKSVIRQLKSYDTSQQDFLSVIAGGVPGNNSIKQKVVDAINTYEAEVAALGDTLKRRLTDNDLAALGGRVKELIGVITSATYTQSGVTDTLESLTK